MRHLQEISSHQQHISHLEAMATIQTSGMKRVKGVFNCADMPGETASPNNNTSCMCPTLRAIFAAHQEEKRRAEEVKKSYSEAEEEKRKKAAQQEAERKDSPAERHVCKSG